MTIWSVFYLLFQFFNLSTGGFKLDKSSLASDLGPTMPKIETSIDSTTKYIYLSFDDGPLFGTASCIDICAEAQVKATFFQIGLHQSRSKWGKLQYQRIVGQPNLFLLSNHSFSHSYGSYLKFYHQADAALEDFKHAALVLQTQNNIVRLPGNNGWSTATIHATSKLVRPLVHKLDSAGFNVVGWDVEWRFTNKGKPIQTPERMGFIVDSMFEHNQNRTKNHLIVLMHDHMFRKSDDSVKLVQFIQYLKFGNRYQFALLDHYPGLKK